MHPKYVALIGGRGKYTKELKNLVVSKMQGRKISLHCLSQQIFINTGVRIPISTMCDWNVDST